MPSSFRILVIGATGAFGARLVRLLLERTEDTLILAARDTNRLEAEARRLASAFPGRSLEIARLDRDTLASDDLARLAPGLVIDAAGPWQGRAPVVARAAIAAGIPSVDLADARDFVAAFPALGPAARAANVLALTAASSTPTLSNLAAAALVAGWRSVETVEVAISPGNRAPRGRAVVEAILSWAGRPVRIWRDGAWTAAPGWGLTRRMAMPGLGHRWQALCETPDLDILPARFPTARTALFRAGLELSLLHLGLWLLTWPVRLGLLARLTPLAGLLRHIAGWFAWAGTDRGGMTVEAAGTDAEGRFVTARWALVAESGDGPAVPVLPALALARKLAAGTAVPPGARVAFEALTLAEVEAEFAGLAVSATLTRAMPPPPFETALGAGFARMPAPLRDLHRPGARSLFRGRGSVTGAENVVGRLVARLFGFPRANADGIVEVEIVSVPGGEVWTRRFDGRPFASRLAAGDRPGRLTERFGPFAFDLDVPANEAGLAMRIVGGRVFGLDIAEELLPWTVARERVDAAGRFVFDVAIGLPLVGRLVHYRGWLARA